MRIQVPSDAIPVAIEAVLGNGDYAKCAKYNMWIIRAPNGDMGSFKNPPFIIEEHEDGTITVGPASMQFNTGKRWHGYLKRGAWSQA